MKSRSHILRSSTALLCVCASAVAGAGCRHTIAVEPIEVKPIHMTLDINLKVDRELDEFFDDMEPSTAPDSGQADSTPVPTPATLPADVETPGGQS